MLLQSKLYLVNKAKCHCTVHTWSGIAGRNDRQAELLLLQPLHCLRGTGLQGGRCCEDESFGSRNLLEEFPWACPCGKTLWNVCNNGLHTKCSVLLSWVLAPPINKNGRQLKDRCEWMEEDPNNGLDHNVWTMEILMENSRAWSYWGWVSNSTNREFKVTGNFKGDSQTDSVAAPRLFVLPSLLYNSFSMLPLAALLLWGNWTLSLPCDLYLAGLHRFLWGSEQEGKPIFTWTPWPGPRTLSPQYHQQVAAWYLQQPGSNCLSSRGWKTPGCKAMLLPGLPTGAFQHYFHKCVT